jgi:hypothetical protein
MKSITKIRLFLLGLALTASMGAVANADPCVPDPNAVCPLIYDPVICNDGVTYSNSCFAAANCAKGCRPAPPEA